jgi:hypothetical protein
MVIYDARPSAFTQLTTTGEWEYFASGIGAVSAVDASVGNALNPSLDTPGRNIVIADGNVVIKGQLWRCDAPVNTAIPAASAQNRIDRLVLRLTRGATTSATVVQPFIITGTPSGSPAIPPIVQTTTGIWDLPICYWTSTSAGGLSGLTDVRVFINDPWHDMRPLLNSFIGTIAGQYPPQYRFSNDGTNVEVAGFIQMPGSGGPNFNSLNIAVLPIAYRPTSNAGHRWAIGTAQSAMNVPPSIQVDAVGAVQFHNLPTSGITSLIVGITGQYPLDVAGLIAT